jgi:hypothetical protein
MIAALILAAAASGPDKPVRSLAYSFSVTSAASTYNGTIAADVMGVTKDGGLAVRFQQTVNGRANQSFPATQCVVYGDTRVECKDAKNISSVETELARLMGRGFLDGNNLDANNHWRLAGPLGTGSETDDFTVTANDNGVVSITESRDVTGPGASHHAGTISYDMNHTVPLSLKYTDGATGAAPASVQITLTSDSLQKK